MWLQSSNQLLPYMNTSILLTSIKDVKVERQISSLSQWDLKQPPDRKEELSGLR